MSSCKCISQCVLFKNNMQGKPALAKLFKQNYCLNDYADCARYQVFKVLGRESIPSNLFPSHTDRAKEIITEKATMV